MEAGERKKKVFLMRHSQSVENTRIAALAVGFSMTMSQFRHGIKLVTHYDADSPLTPFGTFIAGDVAKQMAADNFLRDAGIEFFAASNLERAQQTLQIALDEQWPGAAPGKPAFEIMEQLQERKPSEFVLGGHGMKRRIRRFEEWLAGREERVLFIAGHSQFFRMMTGLRAPEPRNCDVYECTFSTDAEGRPGGWEVVARRYGVSEASWARLPEFESSANVPKRPEELPSRGGSSA